MDTQKVASQFQLLSSNIIKLNIKNDAFVFSESLTGKKTIDVSYDIAKIGTTETGRRIALLDLKLDIKAKVQSGKFSINAMFRGCFDAPEELPEDQFVEMLKINGCAALYSIARGAISVFSTQLFSNGNIVLPLVNFMRFREIEKQNESND